MNTRDISFSNKNRAVRISNCTEQRWDLIVIGGGITGVGIALDGALRGIKTLLIEKQDFASGTSSKSTKLIHGGLRYLKQLEIGLVRETGTERAIVHHNIPHLVHPETMLLPIVNGGTFSKLSASLAISVYDMLASVPAKDRKQGLNKSETLAKEPLLNTELLRSGVTYSEYRTDDARLTMEIIKAARREGAEALNYMQVDNFVYHQGKVIGVQCSDKLDDTTHEFLATQVVSAAGPWVDKLRAVNNSTGGKSLRLTKGVHVVVDKEKLPLEHSVYFDDFNGRMIFAIPRGGVTYIGTSDTDYKNDLNRVLCTSEDIDYLLETANTIFPKARLQSHDVISSWAGLRPLIHEDGKSPSELSRRDEIFESDSNLISIAGGKLTGFRKMADRIVDLVLDKNPSLNKTSCLTKDYKIHADSFVDYDAFEQYWKQLHAQYASEGLSKYYAWYLVSTFGKNAASILAEASENIKGDYMEAVIKAEVLFAIEYESATLPDDYFNRRTGKLYFDIKSLNTHFDLIIDTFADYFGWSEGEKAEIEQKSIQFIKDSTEIKSESMQLA